MAKHGRLTLKNAGYSMPADAAAYQSPPFYYRGTRAISVAFETDLDAALEVLPAALAVPEPAIAVLSFFEYPWTTFGPYNEVILSLRVEHRNRPMNYIMHIAVTTEPPMLAGREIWGFPKKLAHIEFKSERDMIYGTLERPAGVRLASAIVRPERPRMSPIKRIRMRQALGIAITSRSVSTRSRRSSRSVAGTRLTSCAAKAMPIATTAFFARKAASVIS